MYMRKLIRRAIAASLFANSLIFYPNIYDEGLIMSVAHAKVKTYIGVGEDYASQYESQEVAKLRAQRNAIQQAIEQAGIYLKSYSRTINAELTDDDISVITNTNYEVIGKPQYENIVQQVTDKSTVIVWKATIKVNVDDSEIQKWIELKEEDKSEIVAQNKKIQKSYAENDKQVKELREQAKNAKTEVEINKVKASFAKIDDDFLYNQEIEKANKALTKYYPKKAMEHLEKALKLNPNRAEAYNGIGKAYFIDHKNKDFKGINGTKERYEQALEFCNKAIEIDPNYVEAYKNRYSIARSLYYETREKQRYFHLMLGDLKKIMEIDPDDIFPYEFLGYTYNKERYYDQAIKYFKRAIEFIPQITQTKHPLAHKYIYLDLGFIYFKYKDDAASALEVYDEAINLYSTVNSIGNSLFMSKLYYNRGFCYYKLGEYYKAIKDYTKLIDYNKDSEYYLALGLKSRAEAYKAVGDNARAQADLDRIKSLRKPYRPPDLDNSGIFER